MKTLELDQMENIEGGKDAIAFAFMCGGMAFILGTVTFGLGFLASAACVMLSVTN